MAILTTATQMNLIVATCKNLILSNATVLGLSGITEVFERDEHPAIALENGNVPAAYVVPIMEGGDSMNSTIGSQEVMHEFPLTIYAYYKMTDVATSLQTVRNYAYNMSDYLWGDGLNRTEANIVRQKLEVGYFTMVDNIIHYWIINCTVRSLIQPD